MPRSTRATFDAISRTSLIARRLLLSNPSLECTEVGSLTLRLRDRQDQTGASVELDLADDGRALVIGAIRPRVIGKRVIYTPWSASAADARESEGMRISHHLETSWGPPEGSFVYIRIELTSVAVLR